MATMNYLPGLIKRALPAWTGKLWYHQAFDASPYFLHLIAEAELRQEKRKQGGHFTVHYCFFSDGRADWYIEMKDIERVYTAVIEAAKKSFSFLPQWDEDEREFYRICQQISTTDIPQLRDDTLLNLHDTFVETVLRRNTSSSIIDGFALGTDELLAGHIKKAYEASNLQKSLRFAEVFSTLTAPVNLSFINEAEVHLLQTIEKIQEDPAQKKALLQEHQKRYFWIHNNYVTATILDVAYFEEELARWQRTGLRAKEEWQKIEATPHESRERKQDLLKKLHLSSDVLLLLDLSEQFTQWQDQRKKATFFTTHHGSLLLAEIASRVNISSEELKYLSPREIPLFFSKKMSRKNLQERRAKSVFYWDQEGHGALSGKEAALVQQTILGNKNLSEVNDFRGLTACMGQAQGPVKVVRSVTEIGKVQKGDILVAVMTRPDYIPAMKKAAAIVTDEGGVTCHAAIVSRELGIPCIIGTKIATKVLQDGQIVEVNANHSWVRKIPEIKGIQEMQKGNKSEIEKDNTEEQKSNAKTTTAYSPTIPVLLVGTGKEQAALSSQLAARLVVSHVVSSIKEAEKFLKKCHADIIISSQPIKGFSILPPKTSAEEIEHLLWQPIQKKVNNIRLQHFYEESATILGMSLAGDMRSGPLFQQTAGRSITAWISEMTNGVVRVLADIDNDEQISLSIFRKIREENFFPELQKQVALRARQLLELSRLFQSKGFSSGFSSCSKEELAGYYQDFCQRFMQMRMYSSLPTNMEHLSNRWTKLLQATIAAKIKDPVEQNRALSVLTTPEGISYTRDFELALAKAAGRGTPTMPVVQELQKKYAWLNYTFSGTPLTLQDVKKRCQEKTQSQWVEVLQEEEHRVPQLRQQKQEIMTRYQFDRREQELFQIGAEIVFIKFFRKGVFAESYYSVEFLLEEIGRRIGATVKHLHGMTPQEVLAALQLGHFPTKLVEQRLVSSVAVHSDGKTLLFHPSVKALYQDRIVQMTKSKELRGQVAFSGIARGTVRIVNSLEEVPKVKLGDILISRSTNPTLVPAMHLAAAIVTDAGGLTCHAAIIARELKKPCIVGTTHATSSLSDGDMVEVDATKGVVKILSRIQTKSI